MSIPVRTREGFPPLPSRQPRTFRRPHSLSVLVEASKSFFSHFLSVQNSVENLDSPKTTFSADFSNSWSLRRRFATILGPKTGPRSLPFRCFFENGDFVKIVLPLWWEHSFQGLDLPKIDLEIDCERQRRTTSTKIASDGVSEHTFSVDFGVPLGSQDGLFGPTFGRLL